MRGDGGLVSNQSAAAQGRRTWWRGAASEHIWLHVLLWAVTMTLLAEAKIQLFPNSPFRFSLAPAGLGFVLVYFSGLPIIPTGLAVGTATVLFRTAIGLLTRGVARPDLWGAVPALAGSFLPSGLFYVSQTIWLLVLRAREHARQPRPLLLVGSLFAADWLSNLMELLWRPEALQLATVWSTFLVGIGRSLVVTGVYLAVHHQESQWRLERERQEHRRLLLFVTGLQTEIFFLRKSSAEIEHIMVRAHTLYRRLKGDSELAGLALDVAKDVHEVKKDYQRILAGLERLVKIRDLEPDMAVSDLVELVTDTSRPYAAQLHKEISFHAIVADNIRLTEYVSLVSVLNNVIANAVEACKSPGQIQILAGADAGQYVIRVRDTGTGIPESDWDLVFSPGYTTKWDPGTGEFSTGLGLAQAATSLASLGGDIRVAHSGPGGTEFRLSLPLGR